MTQRTREYRVQLALFLVAILVLLPAVVWGKIHDDEVIYWEIARNIGKGLGPLSSVDPSHPKFFVWHVPLPSYVAAPLAVMWADIVPVRLLAAVVSASGIVAVFRIADRQIGRTGAWLSALLVLSSFHWLRYGGRFYYDGFGFALFWWAVDRHLRGHSFTVGVLLVLAVLARELWLLPALFLGLVELRRSGRWRAVTGAAIPVGVFCLWVITLPGAQEFLNETALLSGGKIVAGGFGASPLQHALQWAKAWLELTAAHGVGALGLVTAFLLARRAFPLSMWAMAGCAALTLSVTPGFLANGGFTQYGLLLTGFVGVHGAAGFLALWDRMPQGLVRRFSPVSAVGALLAAQLVAGNVVINAAAKYGSEYVYGLGIAADREIISLLHREAAGQTVAGIHAAFAPGVTRWFWIERHVERLAQVKPDWIVVYRQWVQIAPDSGVELTEIGPYTVIHVIDPDALQRLLVPGTFERPGL